MVEKKGGGYIELLFLYLADVLATEIWEEFNKFTDLELRQLAKAVPDAVLGSKANSTTTKYLGAFKRWKAWTKDHKLQVFPVKPAHLVVYLQHVRESKIQSCTGCGVQFDGVGTWNGW